MKAVIFRSFLFIIFVGILASIIAYTRGYRLNVEQKTINPTGILVASSFPDGAKIYINGKLKGATNTNITLSPGTYDVEIRKDGYRSWKKSIVIKGEVVIKTDSLLFPQNPSLSPLTSLGVVLAKYSPSNNQIIFVTNNANPEEDGIYLLDNSKKALSLFNPLRLLVLKNALPEGIDYKTSQFEFSPDGQQLLFSVCKTIAEGESASTTSSCENPDYSYLINTNTEKQTPLSITNSEDPIKVAWQENEEKNVQKLLETFKDPIDKIASDSFHIISFSPDDSKILYKATKTVTLPLVITPSLIGADQAQESRNLIPDHLYVYDKKEDKNFEIPYKENVITPSPTPNKFIVQPTPVILQSNIFDVQNNIIWYPDSRHLILNEGKQVSVIDYDGNTRQTVYSGPFDKSFLSVSSDGNLLVLANFNPNENQYPDIYTVGIR